MLDNLRFQSGVSKQRRWLTEASLAHYMEEKDFLWGLWAWIKMPALEATLRNPSWLLRIIFTKTEGIRPVRICTRKSQNSSQLTVAGKRGIRAVISMSTFSSRAKASLEAEGGGNMQQLSIWPRSVEHLLREGLVLVTRNLIKVK